MTTTPPPVRVPTQPPNAPVRPVQLAVAVETVGQQGQVNVLVRSAKRKQPPAPAPAPARDDGAEDGADGRSAALARTPVDARV